jgi:hypothetical protein
MIEKKPPSLGQSGQQPLDNVPRHLPRTREQDGIDRRQNGGDDGASEHNVEETRQIGLRELGHDLLRIAEVGQSVGPDKPEKDRDAAHEQVEDAAVEGAAGCNLRRTRTEDSRDDLHSDHRSADRNRHAFKKGQDPALAKRESATVGIDFCQARADAAEFRRDHERENEEACEDRNPCTTSVHASACGPGVAAHGQSRGRACVKKIHPSIATVLPTGLARYIFSQ